MLKLQFWNYPVVWVKLNNGTWVRDGGDVVDARHGEDVEDHVGARDEQHWEEVEDEACQAVGHPASALSDSDSG